jgi:hypothetical protein
MPNRTRIIAACAAATTAVGLAASIAAPALAATPAPSRATTLSTVYQGKIATRDIVLGPQSSPTLLTRTPRLPAGTYLVTAIVGAVIASHDQIVCAASNVPGGNDGVFGTAGNPGTGSIFGTATMTDTIHVTAGQRLSVSCNSFHFGLGTTVGDAVVEAVPVAHVN